MVYQYQVVFFTNVKGLRYNFTLNISCTLLLLTPSVGTKVTHRGVKSNTTIQARFLVLLLFFLLLNIPDYDLVNMYLQTYFVLYLWKKILNYIFILNLSFIKCFKTRLYKLELFKILIYLFLQYIFIKHFFNRMNNMKIKLN